VRFENAQSTTEAPSEPESSTLSEIRTRNVSDGLTPSPERERRVPAGTPVPPTPISTAEGTPSSTANNNTAPSDERNNVAPNPGEQRSDLANSSPDPGNRPPEPASPPAAPSEIRTPNVSDGFNASPERERRVPAETSVPPAPIPTAEGAPSSTSNNDTAPSDERSDVASNPSEQRSDLANTTPEADAANSSPDPGNRTPDPGSPPVQPPAPSEIRTRNVSDGLTPSPERERRVPAEAPKTRKPETILVDAFLNATFLHKHEPREAFERLLKHQLRAYAPATPQEELLTFRITQKSWILRRLDTLDRVIADSAVTKIREKHPNAAPAACIAMTYLTRGDTEETRFHERIAQQRKDHEAALDRLEAKLQTLQHRREARADRRESQIHRPTARTARSGTFFQHVFGANGHLLPGDDRSYSGADEAVQIVSA
jgi:hypothetical protein